MELNTIAEKLTAMGQTEAAEKIRIQIADLNQRWAALQQVTQERAQTLGSAHEVQRYHRYVRIKFGFNVLGYKNSSYIQKCMVINLNVQNKLVILNTKKK
jgi:hypothetical protein